MEVVKCSGHRGDWITEVTYTDGTIENLATAQKHHLDGKVWEVKEDSSFFDPENSTKRKTWIGALGAKLKVVITKDQLGPGTKSVRKSYDGVYEITNLMVTKDGIRFELSGE